MREKRREKSALRDYGSQEEIILEIYAANTMPYAARIEYGIHRCILRPVFIIANETASSVPPDQTLKCVGRWKVPLR